MDTLAKRSAFSGWLYDWLTRQKFVFAKEQRKGLIIINDNIRIGLLTVLAIGENYEECQDMLQKFDTAIKERLSGS